MHNVDWEDDEDESEELQASETVSEGSSEALILADASKDDVERAHVGKQEDEEGDADKSY